jgi:hypothetical protein
VTGDIIKFFRRTHHMRKSAFILCLASSLAASPAGAQAAGVTKSGVYLSSGADQFALAVTTNTTLTVPPNTTCAYITVEGASVRRTSDGTSATTTSGTLFAAGTQWADCGALATYKFTAVSGSPTLDVEYFK